MNELLKELDAARSQQNNLMHARASVGMPGAFYTAEELEAEIAEQQAVVEDITARLSSTMRN